MKKLLYLLPVLAVLLASCDKEENAIDDNGQENTGTSENTNSNTTGSDSTSTSVGEYVDLGLSVKWATVNLGATKPEEYGDYFAWGETEPYYEPGYAQEDPQQHWKSGKSDGYTWSTYKYQKRSNYDYYMTKYCSYEDYDLFSDNKTVLDLEDDAAHVNWGGDWRMPTLEELEELRTNCTWTWTNLNGVNGHKVQSKKSGYTDKWIFLPAAGCRDDSRLKYLGVNGYYWSNSLYIEVYQEYSYFEKYANLLHFYSSSTDMFCSHDPRYFGLPVRPVCP